MIQSTTALILVLVGCSLPARTQDSSPHENHPIAVIAINGSDHPELIPDMTAYRLYLITVSELPDAPPEARNRQMAYLNQLNMSETERMLLLPILSEFKAAYTRLIADYNQVTEAALSKGMKPDEKAFLKQRDDVVQATKRALELTLTPEAMAQFDSHVQAEKRGMVIYLNSPEVAK